MRGRQVPTGNDVAPVWGREREGRGAVVAAAGEVGLQIKIAWSKSRIRDLEFFRIRGEHEAEGGFDNEGGEKGGIWGR